MIEENEGGVMKKDKICERCANYISDKKSIASCVTMNEPFDDRACFATIDEQILREKACIAYIKSKGLTASEIGSTVSDMKKKIQRLEKMKEEAKQNAKND